MSNRHENDRMEHRMAQELEYCTALDELKFSSEAKDRMRQRLERTAQAPQKPWRIRRAVIAAAVCVLLLSLTVGAGAVKSLLSAREAADALGWGKISAAFEKGSVIEMDQEERVGDYIVRPMAIATVENSDELPVSLETGHSYVVLSFRRADGTAIPDSIERVEYDLERLSNDYKCELLISGIPTDVVNSATMGQSGCLMVMDGICYRVIDCTNLEVFGDRTVYLAVYDSPFETEQFGTVHAIAEDALKMKEDGTIDYFEDFPNPHALFTLPFEEDKADPERAQEYLDSLDTYRDWVNNTGMYAPGNGADYRSFQDVLELFKPYEERGEVPTH